MASPSEFLISTIEVHQVGNHDAVKIWNRGGLAGTLTVAKGDGTHVAHRLIGGNGGIMTRKNGIEVWKHGEEEDPRDYEEANTLCSVCKTQQYITPHGLVCKNGHGGAPPL